MVRAPRMLTVFYLYFAKYGEKRKIVMNEMLLEFDFTYTVRFL